MNTSSSNAFSAWSIKMLKNCEKLDKDTKGTFIDKLVTIFQSIVKGKNKARDVWMIARLVVIGKKPKRDGSRDVRPIAIGDIFLRLLSATVLGETHYIKLLNTSCHLNMVSE
jgi:hypothetical protein